MSLQAVEAAIGDADLPLHITGRWTDSLHQLQAYLMPQVLLCSVPFTAVVSLTLIASSGLKLAPEIPPEKRTAIASIKQMKPTC